MTLVQWVSGRLAAQGIRGVVRAGRALFGSPPPLDEESGALEVVTVDGPPPAKSAGSNRRTDFTIVPQ